MAGALTVAVPFLAGLFFVIPGLFDSTMMSRLAVYPLLGAVVLFAGRKGVGLTHLLLGLSLALLPGISLLWSSFPLGGIPFAVRWFSFGIMVIGFSGSVRKHGLNHLLAGLSAAAVVTSILMLLAGANTLSGNPNRTGMILALGFTSIVILFRPDRWFSWVAAALILAGAAVSSFLTCWAACVLGGSVFLFRKKWNFSIGPLIILMVAGQVLFSLVPETAAKAGPTLELRARIWRYSAVLIRNNLPLGTGTGSARLDIFTSAEPELRQLAGENRRVDYLHSEPLSLVVENGIPGMVLAAFLLFWLLRKCSSPVHAALLAAFWPVFASDLPLATPLGGIPAALFLASVPGLTKKRLNIHWSIPALIGILSLWWAFNVISGYHALGDDGPASSSELETACRRIPWEERIFLASGNTHLMEGAILAALDDSEKFIELYPAYYRGWELMASALSAAGRDAHSAWARAALLIPEESENSDRFLMGLNGINPDGMDPDSACMLGEALTCSRGNARDLITRVSTGDLLFAAERLLQLSLFCREESDSVAARVWLDGLAFASVSDDNIPTELALGFFQNDDLYHSLPADWKRKAANYLELLRERTGMGSSVTPSP